MLSSFTVYLIGICDSVNNLLFVVGILSLAAVMLLTKNLSDYIDMQNQADNEKIDKKLNLIKFLAKCSIICLILNALIPSTRLAASMFIVPNVVNNEKVTYINPNNLDILYEQTLKWLIEVKKENNKEKDH